MVETTKTSLPCSPAVGQSVSWISRFNFVPLRIPLSRIPGEDIMACWIINLFLDVLLCSIVEYFYSLFVFWLAQLTGLSKHGTTPKNTQRYYTTKRLIRYMYGIVVTGHLEISRVILTQWRVIPCESQSPAASKWKALILLAFTFCPKSNRPSRE